MSSLRRGPGDDAAPLDQDTVKQLVDMGMSQEEAEAEAAWDPTETDPKSSEFGFDDIYSVDDALPSDMREDLMRPGYGPETIIAAGFRLEEYAIIRCTLDAVGAPHLKLLIADEKLLHSNLDIALTMPEIDWQAPRPPDWIQGGAWGTKRAILFSGLSVAQQGALIEVLEGQGIDDIAVCANAPEASTRIVGELLAAAVKVAQDRPREPRSAPAADAPPVPQWAEDADPAHVAPAGLPNIADELEGRMKTVSDHVMHAQTVGDVDLSTGLSEEDRARREAFLQGLMPQERAAEYVREVAEEEQRTARSAHRAAREEAEWAAHAAADGGGAPADPVADAVADAVAEVSASGGAGGARVGVARGGQEAAPPPGAVTGDVREAGVHVEPPVAAGFGVSEAAQAEDEGRGVDALKAAAAAMRVPPEVPESVRSEIVPQNDAAESESGSVGVTIDTTAEPSQPAAAAAVPEDEQGGAPARARRRHRVRGSAVAANSGAGEVGLDDLIADDVDGAAAGAFDDSAFVDTWLHGSAGGSEGEAREAPKRQADTRQKARTDAAAPGVGRSGAWAGGAGMAPEDASMDAISRALKAGVDKETLKRYIDEVSEQVADNAGSWLKDVPPEDNTPGSNTAAAQMLGNALRGSQGAPLQYGPQTPPQSGWDMREEVRAENAARAAAGAPLAAKVSAGPGPDAPPGAAGAAAGAAAWRDDARYDPAAPYTPRTSIGHLDPMDGDDEDSSGPPDTADAVRALAQGLGVGAVEDADEFPWLQGSEDLGRESEMGGDAPTQSAPGEWDLGGGAGASAADFDDVPGWKFDGFEGMDGQEFAAAEPAAEGGEDMRTDAPQQVNEDEIDEQVGAARPASYDQLKAAAERHNLDLQELLADARRRGVHIAEP